MILERRDFKESLSGDARLLQENMRSKCPFNMESIYSWKSSMMQQWLHYQVQSMEIPLNVYLDVI